ncbi:MAG: dihydrofolate reductase, partial [Bacteroidales bacterium]|nr:dihydrofolate reductase [Bacteroidales bacterium]
MTPDTTINIIVAVADDWAIGREGDMPWHISADMKFFKATTMGHSLVMGRRTWESIGSRPLPGRQNIVVSARLAAEWAAAAEKDCDCASAEKEDGTLVGVCPCGAVAVSSLEAAFEAASDTEIFVMGGGMIYRQAMDVADRLYVTHVHTTVPDADTYFPAIDPEVWALAERSNTTQDERSGLKYEFRTYVR